MRGKVIIVAIIILAFIVWILTQRDSSKNSASNQPSPAPITPAHQNDSPRIVSTKPDPLEEAIISANEVIEITFNRPLENVGEFKLRIEPKIDVKVELSGDRKTAKIIPVKAYELGSGYTLFIDTETKFDGVGRWGEEKIFHFRTIKYRGI